MMAPAADDAYIGEYVGSGPAEQSIDESKKRSVGGFEAYRHDWGRFNGFRTLTLNWSGMRPDFLVWASVGEGMVPGDTAAGKFVGLARCSVLNVAPGFDKVVIHVHLDWGSPINCQVDYLATAPGGSLP
jgi:hypothetical protein